MTLQAEQSRILAASIFIIALLTTVSGRAAETTLRFERAQDGTRTVYGTIEFSADELVFGQIQGYDTIGLDECVFTTETGHPMLPALPVRIALPTGMRATSVKVLDVTRTEISGQYALLPAQPARRVSDIEPAKFVEPDASAYASATPCPVDVVEFDRQADLAGQSFAVLRIYPVEYVAVDRRLSLRTNINFAIHGEDGYICGDYLSPAASERTRQSLVREVRDLVVNPDDVALRSASDVAPSRSLETGQYDYVIITRTNFIEAFQPLADWKTQKGVPAKIVDRAWIYDNYYGTTNQIKIRSFVADAAATWGTRYFLLGGDTNTIPPHEREILDQTVPNDTYYADYDYDWNCEVNVGRAPARNTSEVAAFVTKVQRYEQEPPLSGYSRTVAMLGFDLNEEGSNEGEGCKELIRSQYIPETWTVNTEYDSDPGPHRDDCIDLLNAGSQLVNHVDHCNTSVLGAGSVNHGGLLYTSDMPALTNDGRFSILYSIGCWPCDYPADTCIAEAFVRNPHGGGIGFVGNSRSGYYNPYVYNTCSLRFDNFFFRRLFLFDTYVLGECFTEHKNHAYMTDDLLGFIFTELTLLGDPEAAIWTEDPHQMSVTHPQRLLLGSQAFDVHVTDDAGPLSEATVCIWKDDEVYAIATTDAGGDAQFTTNVATSGTLLVTATKRNYVPYLGSVGMGYLLDVAVEGGGWVDRIPDQVTYNLNDQVWLIGYADEGWVFDHWSGDAEGAVGAVLVTVTDDMSVSAHFVDACPEDLNGDGLIDLTDLALLLGSYGQNGPDLPADIDGDGTVDLNDLARLLGAYGQTCPTR